MYHHILHPHLADSAESINQLDWTDWFDQFIQNLCTFNWVQLPKLVVTNQIHDLDHGSIVYYIIMSSVQFHGKPKWADNHAHVVHSSGAVWAMCDFQAIVCLWIIQCGVTDLHVLVTYIKGAKCIRNVREHKQIWQTFFAYIISSIFLQTKRDRFFNSKEIPSNSSAKASKVILM